MLRIKFLVFSIVAMMYSLVCFGTPVAAPDSIPGVEEVINVVSTTVGRSTHSTAQTVVDGLEDVLIPIVAIVTPFLVAFLIIFFVLRYQLSKKKAKYAVVEKALEMGKELPVEFFMETPKKTESPLESALVLIGVGLGLAVLGIVITPIFYGAGAICVLIGIAKFIAWKIEGKKEQPSNDLK